MKKYSLFLIVILFLALRLFNLAEIFNFGSDQGLQMLEIYNLYKQKKVSMIGPYSSFVYEGKHFFFGPAPYYLPMAVLAVFKWQPISISYFMLFFHLAGFVFLLSRINKLYGMKEGIIYGILFSFFPPLVVYCRFLWNPNFLAGLSCIGLGIALDIFKNPKFKKIAYLYLGILFGFGMQFHYSFFLFCALIFIWLAVSKKITFSNILYILSGFVIGFLPLIIFELRHNFYNVNIIFHFFTSSTKEVSASFQDYYLLCLWPLLLWILAKFISKNPFKAEHFTYYFLMLWVFVSMFFLKPFYSKSFRMVEGWSYKAEEKTAGIIIKEKSHDKYNIIDITTGDTRAMAVRYLLTVRGAVPMKVEEYPFADELFLYTKLNPDVFLKGSLWELKSGGPWQVVSWWNIQDGVNLYKLEKSQKT